MSQLSAKIPYLWYRLIYKTSKVSTAFTHAHAVHSSYGRGTLLYFIEECFRIMKSEFRARPVYLSRKDRITAHFVTCFTALILYRILEKKLGEGPACEDIIRTLKEMNMLVLPGESFVPEYTRTDLTDQLHDTFGFRTDYEIVSQRNMKKILTASRK